MKVISFSLYGNERKYVDGLLRNVALAKRFYPGWIVLVFNEHNTRIPFVRIHALGIIGQFLNQTVFPGHWLYNYPMFWRFLVADMEDVERFIVRDADSRIGPEEAAAVKEWEHEGKILHTCRAHPAHCRPINGGLWGATWHRPDGWRAPQMSNLIKDYIANDLPHYAGHDPDQHFLCTKVWPWAKDSATQHAAVCREAYPGAKPFPVKWAWPRFMGEVWSVAEDGTETSERPHDLETVPKE